MCKFHVPWDSEVHNRQGAFPFIGTQYNLMNSWRTLSSFISLFSRCLGFFFCSKISFNEWIGVKRNASFSFHVRCSRIHFWLLSGSFLFLLAPSSDILQNPHLWLITLVSTHRVFHWFLEGRKIWSSVSRFLPIYLYFTCGSSRRPRSTCVTVTVTLTCTWAWKHRSSRGSCLAATP